MPLQWLLPTPGKRKTTKKQKKNKNKRNETIRFRSLKRPGRYGEIYERCAITYGAKSQWGQSVVFKGNSIYKMLLQHRPGQSHYPIYNYIYILRFTKKEKSLILVLYNILLYRANSDFTRNFWIEKFLDRRRRRIRNTPWMVCWASCSWKIREKRFDDASSLNSRDPITHLIQSLYIWNSSKSAGACVMHCIQLIHSQHLILIVCLVSSRRSAVCVPTNTQLYKWWRHILKYFLFCF
jgi:hypothetical protein